MASIPHFTGICFYALASVGLIGTSATATEPASKDPGSFAGFELDGIHPFMTYGEIYQLLSERGYVENRFVGFVNPKSRKDGSIRMGRSHQPSDIPPVYWQRRPTTAKECYQTVASKLGDGKCTILSDKDIPDWQPAVKQCAWKNDQGNITIAVDINERGARKPLPDNMADGRQT